MILNNSFIIMIVNIVLVLFCCSRAYSSEVDSRIESSARQAYVIQTFLKADAVSIQSKDGNVILSGTVSKESSSFLAREAVAAVPGVISVAKNLKVAGEMLSELSYAWIVMQIKSTLLFCRNVNSLETSVVSENCVVTLRGVATSLAQKCLSTEYAKDIEGVKSVVNEMVVEKDESKTNIWESTGESIDRSAQTSTSPAIISSGPVGKRLRSGPGLPEEIVRLRVMSVVFLALAGR